MRCEAGLSAIDEPRRIVQSCETKLPRDETGEFCYAETSARGVQVDREIASRHRNLRDNRRSGGQGYGIADLLTDEITRHRRVFTIELVPPLGKQAIRKLMSTH